jgi:hypothetical protein
MGAGALALAAFRNYRSEDNSVASGEPSRKPGPREVID